MTFASLGLSEKIVRAVSEREYTAPTPIQAQAIPAVLSGRDVMAAAQTGTGKTAGFALPILQRLAKGEAVRSNHVRVLVLTPTRELAAQVYESFAFYGKHLALKSTAVFGGVGINPQMMKLRRGVDVLVATPGRLLDLYAQNAIRFSQLETLVLDEADRMLDMGFIRDIRKILALLPKQRQTLLFSATFSDDVRGLAQGMLTNPVHVQVSTRNAAAENVKQQLYPVDQNRKSALLGHLIRQQDWQQVLVFIRTKHGANRLTRKLEKDGIGAAAIHGDKSQGARTRALSEFKRGLTRVLVATDIAARGLDIDQLPQVVNFDLPEVPEDYVHRIGRTGRAGAHGHAVSLVSPAEGKLLEGIERLLKRHLPREFEPGFEPTERLAISRLPDAPAAKAHPGKVRNSTDKRPRRSAPRAGNAGRSHGSDAAAPELPRKHRRRGNDR